MLAEYSPIGPIDQLPPFFRKKLRKIAEDG
jgi:hypothetical protein